MSPQQSKSSVIMNLKRYAILNQGKPGGGGGLNWVLQCASVASTAIHFLLSSGMGDLRNTISLNENMASKRSFS